MSCNIAEDTENKKVIINERVKHSGKEFHSLLETIEIGKNGIVSF